DTGTGTPTNLAWKDRTGAVHTGFARISDPIGTITLSRDITPAGLGGYFDNLDGVLDNAAGFDEFKNAAYAVSQLLDPDVSVTIDEIIADGGVAPPTFVVNSVLKNGESATFEIHTDGTQITDIYDSFVSGDVTVTAHRTSTDNGQTLSE